MFTLKTVGIGSGLVTGTAGIAGAVAYSAGVFDSNIQISKLLKEENKYALLPTDGDTHTNEWGEAWKNYKEDNKNNAAGKDKWGLTGWRTDLDAMTADFKAFCSKKSEEGVKDRKDPKYTDITRYCSRPKSLKEVLAQEGINNLLATQNEDQAWTSKYTYYSKANNKLPEDTSSPVNSFETLRTACQKAAELKTTDTNYSKTYAPFKAWCLQQ